MTFKNCKLINTWGFIENSHYKPIKPYESYYKMISYPDFNLFIHFVKNKNIDKPIIFCHPDAIEDFIKNYMPKIDFPFILVTNHFDTDMPTGIMSIDSINIFLSNPNIIRWYMQNCVIKHPKITSIPIGLDYHTISNNPQHYWGNFQTPIEQEQTILDLRKNITPILERKFFDKIYTTCNLFFGNGHGQDRRDAIKNINKELLDLEEKNIPRIETWKKHLDYGFILSPHGNGLDCHRTWEALVLGCIPIVKTSPIDNLYKNLPVLIVKQWNDVTTELLCQTIAKYKDYDFNQIHERLSLKFWIDKINNGDDDN